MICNRECKVTKTYDFFDVDISEENGELTACSYSFVDIGECDNIKIVVPLADRTLSYNCRYIDVINPTIIKVSWAERLVYGLPKYYGNGALVWSYKFKIIGD